ncbi:MAG TPA: potassium channel family protein [Tepidisphaeraceae bacterium]|jgi:hypothetical protein|nr:potassium channel family protein [Tepidisphaeraceae bacterium]
MQKKVLALGGLGLAFVLLGGTWVGLLRLLPDGLPYRIAIFVIGLMVVAVYIALLVLHVRRILGDRGSLAFQLTCVLGEMVLLLAAFASIHQRLGILDNTGASTTVVHDFWRSFYFSFITFTSVGFGDFYPVAAGRALAALQGFTGYLVLGILASTAASLLSPHSPEGPHDNEAD